MVNDPHLLKGLCLTSNRGQVDGISNGLDIQGEGTFKFSIKDNKGKVHTIRIPNSLYLTELRKCLLSPQHWVQESGDWQTWMGNHEHNCVLNWKGGRKTIPFNMTTNTPIFYTAPSSCAYCALTSIFEAFEAPYYCREMILQFPGCRRTVDKPNIVPEEFVAEENVNYCKVVLASEGVNVDDKTVKTSNLSSPPQDDEPSEVIR
jgi:hypothetical protein